MASKTVRRGCLFDKRVWVLLIPALGVLAFDMPVMLTLLYSLAAIFVVASVALIIRLILFPYVDLEVVEDIANESPTGAGLVFLGICVMISSIVLAAALWISR